MLRPHGIHTADPQIVLMPEEGRYSAPAHAADCVRQAYAAYLMWDIQRRCAAPGSEALFTGGWQDVI